jgi:RimJ/RimL family protein N-acetyltransferase
MSVPLTSAAPTGSTTAFEGDRVRFTPLQMDNIYTHFRWNNDPELNRLDSEIPYEEETFGQFKQRFERMCLQPSPTQRDFEIHALDAPSSGDGVPGPDAAGAEGTLIGVAYVADISAHHRHGLVGVTIGARDYWGAGYGRESLALLLAFCFDDLDLHRVSAETFEYNTAWRNLVVGAGFQKEGTAREYLYRDDRFWDKENFALLRREHEA